MHCGDHFTYYKEAVAFCRTAYSVQPPEGADVVVSNTYPNDLSLTFARTKGMTPLHAWAPPHATRIAVAACTEGIGRHNLFPLAHFPDAVWFRAVARRASVMKFSDVGKKLARRIASLYGPEPQGGVKGHRFGCTAQATPTNYSIVHSPTSGSLALGSAFFSR